MKKSVYIIGILVVALVGTILYFTVFNAVETTGDETHTTHEDEHNHAEVDDRGEVIELNQAQYENAGIKLGAFEQKNLNDVIHANGYTKLPPQNQADVSVFTSGIIESIKVIEGQHVKKGQTLAVISSPEFAKIQQAYLISKSQLAYLETDYERQLKLSEENVNAKKTLQKIKSELDAEQATFNSLKKQLDLLKINGDGQTVSTIPILAPITGNITEVYVKIGTMVEFGKPLFSIVDNSEMHIDLLVYEKDLSRVAEGQSVRFNLTNQSNREIKGTIFNIGKSFENETKTVAVHADIEETTENLIPGMYVNAIIDIGAHKVDALPESAVIQAEGRSFIFVQQIQQHHHQHGDEGEEDQEAEHEEEITFVRIEVSTGPSQLGFIQVTPLHEIKKGEKIVIDGAYYLQSHFQKSEGAGGHSH